MRHRRGPEIPASGLLPPRRSPRRLRANTRGDGVRGRGRGGRSVTQPRGGPWLGGLALSKAILMLEGPERRRRREDQE